MYGEVEEEEGVHCQQAALSPEDEDVEEEFAYSEDDYEREEEEENTELPLPVTERQREYLRVLQQRNRALKQVSAKTESELEQERREKGFDIHFRGANERRPKKGSSDSGFYASTRSTAPSRRQSLSRLKRGVGTITSPMTSRRSSSDEASSRSQRGGGLMRRKGPLEEEKGEGKRRCWSKDKPLDYIRADDGKIVPVDLLKAKGRDVRRNKEEKNRTHVSFAADEGDGNERDGCYEDDFDDDEIEGKELGGHEEEQASHIGLSNQHDDEHAAAGSHPWMEDDEDEYQDEEEEEEEEQCHVDKARVLRAIVHQASHRVADIRGGRTTTSTSTTPPVFPSSDQDAVDWQHNTSIGHYPWDGEEEEDAEEKDSQDAGIKLHSSHGRGTGPRPEKIMGTTGSPLWGDSTTSEMDEIKSLVDVSGGQHEDFEQEVAEECSGSGSIQSPIRGDQEGDTILQPFHQSSHQKDKGGGQRQPELRGGATSTPPRVRQAMQPLAVTKIAAGQRTTSIGNSARGSPPNPKRDSDKEMREVLAALELENRNTPRYGSHSPAKKRPLSHLLLSPRRAQTRANDGSAAIEISVDVRCQQPPLPPTPSLGSPFPLNELEKKAKVSLEEQIGNESSSATTTRGTEENDVSFLPAAAEAPATENEDSPADYQELALRIYNTWGGTRVVGLEQIDILKEDGSHVLIGKDDMSCRMGLVKKAVHSTDKMAQDLEKLCDGIIGSNSERHLWLGRLGSDSPLDVCFRLENDLVIGAVRVWNYRRTPNVTKIGAKDVDVILNGRCTWSGMLKEGMPGSVGDDCCKEICLTTSITTSERSVSAEVEGALAPKAFVTEVSCSTAAATSSQKVLEPRGVDGEEEAASEKPGSSSSLSPGKMPHEQKHHPIWLSDRIGRPEARSDKEEQPHHHDSLASIRPSLGERKRGARVKSLKEDVENHHHSKALAKSPRSVQTTADNLSSSSKIATTPRRRSHDLGGAIIGGKETALSAGGGGEEEEVFLSSPSVVIATPTKTAASDNKEARRCSSSLHESWESLAQFERMHKGRLGMGEGERNITEGAVMQGSSEQGVLQTDILQQEMLLQESHPIHATPTAVLDTSMCLSPQQQPSQVSSRKERQQQQQQQQQTMSLPPRQGITPLNDSTNSYEDLLRDLCREVSDSETGGRGQEEGRVYVAGAEDGLPIDSMEASLIDVPTLPRGRLLTMQLLSTWGDPNYIALAGIDIFDALGQPIYLKDPKKQVTVIVPPNNLSSHPTSHGAAATTAAGIPSCCTPDKLFDGVNLTQDDFHVWLAPFQNGHPHRLEIDLVGHEDQLTLSMIRLWNYNKSRTHSYRGVRRVRLLLDGKAIFEGDIARAPGLLEAPEQCYEIILFTFDQHVLRRIEEWDGKEGYLKGSDDAAADRTTVGRTPGNEVEQGHCSRPWTNIKAPEHRQGRGSQGIGTLDLNQALQEYEEGRVLLGSTRSSMGGNGSSSNNRHGSRPDPSSSFSGVTRRRPCLANVARRQCPLDKNRLYSGRRLQLHLQGTWGDSHLLGLGCLQVLVGPDLRAFPLRAEQINCLPIRDLKTMGYTQDQRVLENLIKRPWDDDEGETTASISTTSPAEEELGWLIPLAAAAASSSPSHPVIAIDLGSIQCIAGLAVWNYNRTGPTGEEDTLRGVRSLSVLVDGKYVSTFSLRKGPVVPGLDHVQVLFLQQPQAKVKGSMNVSSSKAKGGGIAKHTGKGSSGYVTYVTPPVRQDYETLRHPTGLLLQITIHGSWGCPFYLGLDGLQLLGPGGKEIELEPERVQAWPSSLHVLGGGSTDDCRVPGNLVDHILASQDASHSWLAPFAPSLVGSGQETGENVLMVLMDQPISLSAIRFWNYRKTPTRGVREISVALDGKLLFKGTIKRAPSLDEDGKGEYAGQVVLFTNDPALVKKEKDCILYCGGEEQDVLCVDERQIRVRSKYSVQDQPDPSAEGVVIDPALRPLTSVIASQSNSRNRQHSTFARLK